MATCLALFVLALGFSQAQMTASSFKCMFPRVSNDKVNTWIPYLNAALKTFNVNTTLRVQMFMAQTGMETDSYNTFKEYTNADGTNAWCHRYSGGCKYIGRGAMQLTHDYNYRACGRDLGVGDQLVNNPTQVATPQWAFKTAGWYWKKNNLNTCAQNQDIVTCTRIINGGTNGLDARKAMYAKAKQCIGGGSSPVPPPPPRSGSCSYIVRSGDTFSGIAQRYGLSINALKALNPQIPNINIINVGQKINVPCRF